MTWQPNYSKTRAILVNRFPVNSHITDQVLEASGAIEEIQTLGQDIVQANAHIDQLRTRIRQLEADLLTERHF